MQILGAMRGDKNTLVLKIEGSHHHHRVIWFVSDWQIPRFAIQSCHMYVCKLFFRLRFQILIGWNVFLLLVRVMH